MIDDLKTLEIPKRPKKRMTDELYDINLEPFFRRYAIYCRDLIDKKKH